jgi:hypothetical protein
MTYAEPYERAALIDGLRALADYLEANPGVPVPSSTEIFTFPLDGECARMRAEIDAIAEMIGRKAYATAGRQHYLVTRSFGPVEYRAVAICKQHDHASDQAKEAGK